LTLRVQCPWSIVHGGGFVLRRGAGWQVLAGFGGVAVRRDGWRERDIVGHFGAFGVLQGRGVNAKAPREPRLERQEEGVFG
jgi:hypothetical protein